MGHLKQKLSNIAQQLNRQIVLNLNQQSQRLDFLAQRLISPAQKLKNQMDNVKQLQSRLNYATQQVLYKHQQQLKQLQSSVAQLSPEAVLSRGYAIVSHDGKPLTDSQQTHVGQALNIQLHHGKVEASVTKRLTK